LEIYAASIFRVEEAYPEDKKLLFPINQCTQHHKRKDHELKMRLSAETAKIQMKKFTPQNSVFM
jgi:hypothetical protein